MRGDPPETAPVRAGEDLDWARLESHLRERLGLTDPGIRIRQFPYGSANLTYLVTIGDRRLVVRRPPFGKIAAGAHDMGREYRVLSRLHRAYARAPRGLLFTEDPEVIGAPFLVIDYREGVVVRRTIPAELDQGPDTGRRIGLAAIDALADLHAVDPATCGLDDLGRPEGYLQRQVDGWARRWDAVAGGPADVTMRAVAAELARAIPQTQRSAVLHNDFKVDNCQFRPGDPDTVVSVFDWDMATLGDPLSDLGMLMNYWPDLDGPPVRRASAIPWLAQLNLGTRAEVLERYAATTGLDLGQIDWYEALGCWKTAIILQQLFVRHQRGESADPRMAERGRNVDALAQKAVHLLDLAHSSDRLR